MCANYTPVTRAQRLLEYFGVDVEQDLPPGDVFPMGLAPFMRLAHIGDDPGHKVRFANHGIFRFVPEFASKLDWARKTFNARSEEVHLKKNYRRAWADGQRCIIPAEAVYEPNYESGASVRWRISLGTGGPMGIAGIYPTWVDVHGETVFSIAMLTVNADSHPFMNRFHAPGDEKRMVVILDPGDFSAWLTCTPAAAQAKYCKQWTGPLTGEPAALPSRKKIKPQPEPASPPPPPSDDSPDIGQTGSLF